MDSVERNAEIIRMYAGGVMLKDIAVSVGLAPNTVGGILKRMGVSRPAKPQKRSVWRPCVDRDDVIELWNLGMAMSAIAERLGVGRQAVNDVLTASGVRTGQPPRHRYDGAAIGGSGRSGFAGNMARRT